VFPIVPITFPFIRANVGYKTKIYTILKIKKKCTHGKPWKLHIISIWATWNMSRLVLHTMIEIHQIFLWSLVFSCIFLLMRLTSTRIDSSSWCTMFVTSFKIQFQCLDGIKLNSKNISRTSCKSPLSKNKYARPYGINSRVVHATWT
jgi:hypothetical protein